MVVGVEANGQFLGFPLDMLAIEGGVANTQVGGLPVVVLYDPESQTGIGYARTIGDLTLTFERASSGGFQMVDDQTGSVWDIGGTALSGQLVATRLEFVPSFISEWYGWSGYHPETGLYQGVQD